MQSFSHALNPTISCSTIKSRHKYVLGTSNWPGAPSAAKDQNDMIYNSKGKLSLSANGDARSVCDEGMSLLHGQFCRISLLTF